MMSTEKSIPFIIEDKFEVRKFGSFGLDEEYKGTVRVVQHNGAKLTFTLLLIPNRTHKPNFIGVFVEYTNGPKEKLKINSYFYTVRDSSETPMKPIQKMNTDPTSDEFTRYGDRSGWGEKLPRNLASLRAKGWLRSNNSVLHIMAVLLIPESAFDDPEMKCQVSTTNPFFESLFSQIRKPVDTSSAYNINNRFDFISSDHQHFFVHKDVLSFSSDAFKQMFDPDKPEDAQFEDFKKGFMRMKKLNATALHEFFSFIYLGHTTPELGNCALQVLDAASMYGLHALFLLCEQKLIAETKQTKDMPSLLQQLEVSLTHNLTSLTDACICSLKSVMNEQKDDISEDVVLRVIEVANQHQHTELRDIGEKKLIEQVRLINTKSRQGVAHFVSIGGKFGLKKLLDACCEYRANNSDKLTENGKRARMEDMTDGVLLDHMLSKYAKK